MSIASGLKSVVSFLTTIPVGAGSLEDVATYAYLFPIVGAIMGLVYGVSGLFFFNYLPSDVAGWMLVAVIALMTGLNHIDGLVDLGDALMVRGTKERKLEILHDKHHGVGAFILPLLVIMLTQSSLVSLRYEIFAAVITAESFAKLSMVLMGGLGNPHGSGLGATFINRLRQNRGSKIVIASVIAMSIALLLNPLLRALFCFLIVTAFSALMVGYFHRSFGCITGDMIGSVEEFSRVLVLLALLVVV